MDWFEETCGVALDWRREIDSAGEKLQKALAEAQSPSDVRSELGTYFRTGGHSTDDLLRRIRQAGRPPVEEGDALRQRLEQEFRAVAAYFDRFAAAAGELPVANREEFDADLRALLGAADEEENELGNPFDDATEEYASGEIGRAYREAAACRIYAEGG